MKRKDKYQFGIRTLLILLSVTAFSIVIIEHLADHKEEALVYSLIVSLVSATVGVAMLGLSGLFAFCIAITQENANMKAENLNQCFHMLIFGVVALGPICLLVALSIFA